MSDPEALGASGLAGGKPVSGRSRWSRIGQFRSFAEEAEGVLPPSPDARMVVLAECFGRNALTSSDIRDERGPYARQVRLTLRGDSAEMVARTPADSWKTSHRRLPAFMLPFAGSVDNFARLRKTARRISRIPAKP